MIELYDRVMVKKNEFPGNIVSIDDNNGRDIPIYLVEIDDEYKDGSNDLIWCEKDEIELIEKF